MRHLHSEGPPWGLRPNESSHTHDPTAPSLQHSSSPPFTHLPRLETWGSLFLCPSLTKPFLICFCRISSFLSHSQCHCPRQAPVCSPLMSSVLPPPGYPSYLSQRGFSTNQSKRVSRAGPLSIALIVAGIELFVLIECLSTPGSKLEQGTHGRLVCLQLPLPSSMSHKLQPHRTSGHIQSGSAYIILHSWSY